MHKNFEEHEICRDSNPKLHGDNLNNEFVQAKLSPRQLRASELERQFFHWKEPRGRSRMISSAHLSPTPRVTSMYRKRHKTCEKSSFHSIFITFWSWMTDSEIHVRAPRTIRMDGRPCRLRPLWFGMVQDPLQCPLEGRGWSICTYFTTNEHRFSQFKKFWRWSKHWD